jgi:hypothetical protein
VCERESVLELSKVRLQCRGVCADVVRRLACVSEASERGVHGGRCRGVEGEEFAREPIGGVDSPQACLAEALLLGFAVVPIQRVRGVYGVRLDVQ